MSDPLHPNDHARELERDGHDVHDSPIPITIEDGFYRIVQRQTGGDIADASVSSAGEQDYPVVMSTAAQLESQVWRLTNQYGIENIFTIVPQDRHIGGLKDPQLGATTSIEGEFIRVKRTNHYPIWNIAFQTQKKIRNRKTGAIKERTYFSILGVGSDMGWTTDNAKIKLAGLPEEDPPANQIFEIIKASNEKIVPFSSAHPLSVRASGGTVVRKLYFGTGKLSADEINRYITVQLETDAHDQGWADEPGRGLWSWFEVAIFSALPAEGQDVTPHQIKPGPNGEPLTWVSHTLPLSKEYKVLKGKAFTKQDELLKSLKEGDYIGVLACAQYRAWEGNARSGRLIIHELSDESD